MSAKLKASLLASYCVLAILPAVEARAEQYDLMDAAATAPPPAITPTPAQQSVAQPSPPLATTPDESALRYYTSRNETQRVNAEIARLQRFYPNWRPPKDLYDAHALGGEDEADLWDLFAADRVDELEAAITARKASEPGWAPSADLQQKLRHKAARLKIADYMKQGRWQDIVDYERTVDAAADADIDVGWTIAEAFARTKQTDEAERVYKAILTKTTEPDQRVATIQKAMAAMRMADVEPLIAMGARPDGSSEFAPIMVDITRARISAFLHDERTEDVADADLRLFEDFARTASDPNQAGLVGWYDYKHKNFADALEWFKLSLARGGDAMVAHGLAHSLRELNYLREAEEVSYAWRKPLINNAILFIDLLERDLTREVPPYIEPERLFRYAEETLRIGSGEGAQALAWYAYNSCQFDVALVWFERANAWFPKEATAYGYALTLRRLHRSKEFLEVVNRYDGLFPKVIELIFPDNYYHPPTPCERRGALRSQPQERKIGDVPAPGPAMFRAEDVTTVTEMEMKQRQLAAAQRPERARNVARAGFPQAVDPQNDLRFSPLIETAGDASPLAPAAGVAFLRPEAPAANIPLVARRVPGVGQMPYERYGFALLPGYNGQTSASAPHSALYAAAGTPWAQEHSAVASPASIEWRAGLDLRNAPPLAVADKAPGEATWSAPAQPQWRAISSAPSAPSNLISATNDYQYGIR